MYTGLKNGKTLTERLGNARLKSRDITELLGVCKGVLADGVVNLSEALFILQWLEDHRSIVSTWPADVLYETLDQMLEDGELSSRQEGDLVGLLADITGAPIRIEMTVTSDAGSVLGGSSRTLNTSTALPLAEPAEGLIFQDRNFVLTGHFLFGPRRECEVAVCDRGGNTQKGVNKKTDYLVIGEVGSESWAHSSFGRKIEKAVYMREAGHEIYIVSEATWASHLQ